MNYRDPPHPGAFLLAVPALILSVLGLLMTLFVYACAATKRATATLGDAAPGRGSGISS